MKSYTIWDIKAMGTKAIVREIEESLVGTEINWTRCPRMNYGELNPPMEMTPYQGSQFKAPPPPNQYQNQASTSNDKGKYVIPTPRDQHFQTQENSSSQEQLSMVPQSQGAFDLQGMEDSLVSRITELVNRSFDERIAKLTHNIDVVVKPESRLDNVEGRMRTIEHQGG